MIFARSHIWLFCLRSVDIGPKWQNIATKSQLYLTLEYKKIRRVRLKISLGKYRLLFSFEDSYFNVSTISRCKVLDGNLLFFCKYKCNITNIFFYEFAGNKYVLIPTNFIEAE